MTHQLSIPIAFVAGVVSFLSPCVLPLVPGYISMLSGATIEELKSGASAALMARILRNSLAFIVGFSIVFIALGASATWVGKFLLARRIIFDKKVGETVARGERVGLIKFGSRVDVLLDGLANPQVKVGDHVRGGASVLALVNVGQPLAAVGAGQSYQGVQ